ncbi:CobW family GTP-binding protein [Mycolicibacterium grossiae]|uniref:Cobalamin biosynthesis protein CobW n=1 Tax=Mycolicibacterium grossiae TaxID=1552759 RepID=A0A1E8Q1E4_9MYCO|nr:GTP-binding protein [Mycolicibacterium grossiae]OFJ52385.1 cobalamin biosynthesis protein CobW [Mycolicibacterium grossiae]QEM44291.1 GTP-binding protein [Mycolicibacterium grossiae]
MEPIPVIALTGYLGAGKTTLLNHVLRAPGARIGVVINDFGELNVDAGLVTGQIDEPASITGGCICCLPDDGGLDEALAKLADPKLALDAIIVEASGLADPVAIARIIRFSGAERVRPGGVVDVIDAAAHFDTVDTVADAPPARYAAASLVVVNKLDRFPDGTRDDELRRIEARVRERNPDAHVVGVVGGRIDPTLLYDVSGGDADGSGQLSFRDLLADEPAAHADHPDHVHASSVTVLGEGCVDPGAVVDLAENPPPGVYRLKGTVAVRSGSRVRRYVVNVVGTSIHVMTAPATTRGGRTPEPGNSLVAIGTGVDTDVARTRLEEALRPVEGPAPAVGLRRLQRYRQLSL